MPNTKLGLRATMKGAVRRCMPDVMWGMLRRARTSVYHRRFPRRIVSHEYHGQRLTVHLEDGVAVGWYDHDWPRQFEIDRLAESKLGPGATVYDLGAHQCVVALVLAGIVGPGGTVVAVEAEAHNVTVARKNVSANAAGRAPVHVVFALVAAREGELRFNADYNLQAATAKGAGTGLDVVPAVTINSLSRQYPLPDVVFIDVEGAEAMALSACEDVFRDGNRPTWFVEVHSDHGLEKLGGSVGQIVDFFSRKGYRLEWADPAGEQFRPLDGLPKGRFFLVAADSPHVAVQPTPAGK